MQRIAIIGHLSSCVEVCNQENKAFLRFQVAVKDREIDLYTGEVKEETQHFEAVYWTNQTKIANQLKEGSKRCSLCIGRGCGNCQP